MRWIDEVRRRIAISEGSRTTMYRDSRGIPTIGIGYNLLNHGTVRALMSIGVTDVRGVLSGTVALTEQQVSALFDISFAPVEEEARKAFAPGIFDAMTDARRFVICDMIFNLGEDGFDEFTTFRALLMQAQFAKNENHPDAHADFNAAANDLTGTAWYSQVGSRAVRNVAMIRSGEWVDPYAG